MTRRCYPTEAEIEAIQEALGAFDFCDCDAERLVATSIAIGLLNSSQRRSLAGVPPGEVRFFVDRDGPDGGTAGLRLPRRLFRLRRHGNRDFLSAPPWELRVDPIALAAGYLAARVAGE